MAEEKASTASGAVAVAPPGGEPGAELDGGSADAQNVAVLPAMAEAPQEAPALMRCQVQRLELANSHGGRRAMREIIVSSGSERQYLLDRRLSEAIYGEVWAALEVEVEGDTFTVQLDAEGKMKRYAIKRINWATYHEKRQQNIEVWPGKDPMREVMALMTLQTPGHAHVLNLVEALDCGKTIFLVTPFIDGGEMFDWVVRNAGSAAEEIVKPLFRQIVDGMRYMHLKGVCHADMSLENALMESGAAAAYIIDFGMSARIPIGEDGRRHMSAPDRRFAKPSYRSPEVFKQKAYDSVKVDVFAAGAMLFMMLTGFPPFSQATRADMSFYHVVWKKRYRLFIRKNGGPVLSDEAINLLEWMMAYEANERPLPQQVLEHPWLATTT